MARYNIGFTKTTGAAAGLLAQLRTGSTRDIRLSEIGIFASTAVSGTVGLIRPSAVGSGFTSTATGVPEDPTSAAGIAVVDTAATTAPTISTNYARTATLPATIGAGIIWTFPDGIVIPLSSALSIWQTSTAAVTYSGYFAYDE